MSLGTSSECPFCRKKLSFSRAAQRNVQRYQTSATAVSECCGRPFRLSLATHIVVEPYNGNMKEDDWGNPIMSNN